MVNRCRHWQIGAENGELLRLTENWCRDRKAGAEYDKSENQCRGQQISAETSKPVQRPANLYSTANQQIGESTYLRGMGAENLPEAYRRLR